MNSPEIAIANTHPDSNSRRSWEASLSLCFAGASPGRTTLRHCEHKGPLRVQRLFHPDPDGTAHCYVLHPPGGVVLGDKLVIDAAVDSGRALLTTPSAGRFYGVGAYSERQQQHVRLTAGNGASLWWLPQETIVFPGANALLDTQIALAPQAELVWWDIVVLGCPASGPRFESGCLEQRLRICRDGQAMLEERVALSAGDRYANSPMGLGGASTFGMMVLTTGASEAVLHSWLCDVNGADGEGAFSVTQRGELLIARYLGEDAAVCRHGFSALWRRSCAAPSGVEPSEPRIWHT